MATLQPCPCTTDRKLWKDEPAQAGVIRTVCKKCKRWIGNRFVTSSKQPKEAKPKEPK